MIRTPIRTSRILFTLLLILSALPARSRDEHYVFSQMTAMNGLSDNNIRSIGQIPDGRIVVITQGQLNLFDGASFRGIHFDQSNATPLPGYTGHHQMYISSEGHLWLKNQMTLMLIDIDHMRYVPDADSVLLSWGVREPLSDFFMDDNHDFWLVTRSGKLLRRHEGSDTSELFLDGVNRLGDRLFDIATIGDEIFLFYRSGTMICYGIADGRERYRNEMLPSYVSEEHSWYVLHVITHDGYLYQLWNGTTASVALRYDTRRRRREMLLETDYWLNVLSIDAGGDIWISCREGLWHIDSGTVGQHFLDRLSLVDGEVVATEVSTLYNDSQGGFWVGTLDRGLLYHHRDRFAFRNVGTTLFGSGGLSALKVTGFAVRGTETIVGTDKGLFVGSESRTTLSLWPGFTSTVCHSLLRDSSGEVWVGTEEGLFRLSDKSAPSARPRPAMSGVVNHIFESRDGTFYVCVPGVGFGVFDRQTGAFSRTGSYSWLVFQLIDFGEDRLLGISSRGVFIHHPSTGEILFPNSPGWDGPEVRELNNRNFNCLLLDSRGLVWFGSFDGLHVWDPSARTFRSFHTEDGLVNNFVCSLTEDSSGKIWATTSNGVSNIEIVRIGGEYRYSVTSYNHYDGTLEHGFMNRSALLTSDGMLFAGGYDGFNIIDTGYRRNPSAAPGKPLFVDFLLAGTEIDPNRLHHGHISLRYNQNNFTIGFSALNYVNPAQTWFRYILEGADGEWHETGSVDGTGSVHYMNLPAGRYTFRVRAAAGDRVWRGEDAELSIVVADPWWATPWALMIYLLLVCGVFSLGLWMWMRAGRRKMERQQNERMDEMKFRFFTNINHDLRTPLTLILTPLEVILGKLSPGELKEQLDRIYRNGQYLLDMINQLLDFRRIEAKGETVELSLFNVGRFIESLTGSFQDLTRNRRIALTMECGEDVWAHLDRDKLHKIFYNLLSNAVRFTPDGGAIRVMFDTVQEDGNDEHRWLRIRMEDTGCGIAEKDIPHIFTRFYRGSRSNGDNTGSGLGLHIVREYVMLHNGTVKVESRPGEGSLFTVLLPSDLEPEHAEAAEAHTHEVENLPKLLVVEDNEEFLDFLCDNLSGLYRVTRARDGLDGWEAIGREEPDLILSDIMMPRMNGLELCARVKGDIRFSHIPTILLTARSSSESELQGYGAGADAYISKPFRMEILQRRIRNLIDRHDQRKALFRRAIVLLPENLTATDLDQQLIRRVLDMVEKNLSNSDYSVDQLSRDMCMDRTGLYRKLMAIVGQPPTAFMRSVRLKKAAVLLKQGLSISEIAGMVGFGSVSYFSKCFQEEFGVKPSRYV